MDQAVEQRSHATYPFFLRRLDALVLGVLVIARLRIDSFAEATVLPLRQNDVARQPWLGNLLSKAAMKLLAQQQTVDPIALLLIVSAVGCFLAYLAVDEWVRPGQGAYRLKLALIGFIIALSVFAPGIKLMLLRQGSGPASYSHDGGVIQTEATINYFLTGRNPYVENYVNTPMAEWGINEFRTALYHYPYLPLTFVFSTPFKLAADRLIGWYDQRMVYLLLFAVTLALLPGLARGASAAAGRGQGAVAQAALLLVMVVGLNPLMGSDLIYGQNDSFILAWIVFSLWFWTRGRNVEMHGNHGALPWYLASSAAFGLACASKPTAWFMAPFYVLLLAGVPSLWAVGTRSGYWLRRIVQRAWPALAVSLLFVGPWFLWNPAAMVDDVWSWSAGTSPTAYQIWGWGASNLVLAFGWVSSRFAYWPFWVPELLVGVPLMAALLWRQSRDNTLARACWSYALFLFAFFFVSRFLNENYIGFILAFLALGALSGPECAEPAARAASATP